LIFARVDTFVTFVELFTALEASSWRRIDKRERTGEGMEKRTKKKEK